MEFRQKIFARLKKFETWISIAGIITATAFFLNWFFTTDDISFEGGIAAALSLVLFVTVCVKFVPEWMNFWKHDVPCPDDIYGKIKTDKKEINLTALKVFFLLNFVCFFIIIIVYVLRSALYGMQTFSDSLNFWKCLDSGHYLDIAKDWYISEGKWDRLVQLVFLPGYPLIIKLFNVLFNNYLYASLAVSSICFGLAGAMFYKLMRLDYNKQTSLRAIKYVCLIPGIFFFVAPMSESLFLFCSVSCIYFARKRNWPVACLMGGYAAFTRTLGLVLLVPVVFEFIKYLVNKEFLPEKEYRTWRIKLCTVLNACSVLLIPAGFFVYCYINYKVSGDPFKFLYYQKEHWSQEFGWFFNTASYQTDRMISSFENDFSVMLGLWLPNLLSSFSALILMIFSVKKIRPSYMAYAISYFFAAIGATWLLSGPRYLAALFVLPVGLAVLTEKRRTDNILTALCAVMSVFYLYAFVMRWQVW